MQINSMTETPRGLRLHIGVFGRTNSGKSSLINKLAGQAVSLVSPVAGTTTDPVLKPIEIYPLGPCVLIDTAGIGDRTDLGPLRMERTYEALDKTDIALLVINPDHDTLEEEQRLIEKFSEKKIPYLLVLNKADLLENREESINKMGEALQLPPILVSTETGEGIQTLKEELVKKAPVELDEIGLVDHLVKGKERVLLVMPQDIQAPKGRLILPQVQVLRDLLDRGAVTTCVTVEQLPEALLDHTPDLIITDSQVFPQVFEKKPEKSLLTSFSVLMARYKGDIQVYLEGAKSIRKLKDGDRVLIAEACSHQPLDGDISRDKIPNLIHKKISPGISVEIVGGQDFPKDLSPYALVIHCGGCMFSRRQVLSRVMRAVEQNVPITNYGIFFAEIAGILDHVVK